MAALHCLTVFLSYGIIYEIMKERSAFVCRTGMIHEKR